MSETDLSTSAGWPTELHDVVDLRRHLAQRTGRGEPLVLLTGTEVEQRLRLTALVGVPRGIEALDVVLPAEATNYPAITPEVPAAFWHEREIHDLFGVVPLGHPRLDPLVLPLADGHGPRPRPGGPPAPERIVPAEPALPSHVVGDGLFTFPFGPVRSGVYETIEYVIETPGEDIPHLRMRVFAKHRGIEKRFEGLAPHTAVLLAERVEGIASVAHALAFSLAVEELAGVEVPPGAALLRVVHAELERVANHLDVAMKLADAAALAVAVARFGLHKERVLRLVSRLCGSRFGRGVVVPGGVNEMPGLPAAELTRQLDRLERAIRGDAEALMLTASFIDRLRGTGPLALVVARERAAVGPVGRASGGGEDARLARPYGAYRRLPPIPDRRRTGTDAQTRLELRWDEVEDAFALAREATSALERLGTEPPLRVDCRVDGGRGIGWAESPQGEVVYLVEVEEGRIARCKPRSASFQNLVCFHDVFSGDVYTDFAFIEASFGLSIAGVAL